jgi:hypothetical protein
VRLRLDDFVGPLSPPATNGIARTGVVEDLLVATPKRVSTHPVRVGNFDDQIRGETVIEDSTAALGPTLHIAASRAGPAPSE